jgi:suppressor for copper-sensitivity B
MILKRWPGWIILAFALAFTPTAVQAEQSNVVIKTPEVEIALVSALTATDRLEEIPLGLKVRLSEGWKIYWRSPGDAGLPTEVGFAPGTELPGQTLEMDFPIPSRFSLFGLDTYGYGDEVIFPLRLGGHIAGQPLMLQVQVNALVCADICIPVGGLLGLNLPAGQGRASPDARDIARFASLVPKTGTGPDIHLAHLSLEQNPARLLLEMGVSSLPLEDVFVEAAINGLSFTKPRLIAPQIYEIQVLGTSDSAALIGQPVTLTLVAPEQFLEVRIAGLTLASADSSAISASILFILLAAFAGGLILNIMPCVLPVLSLKLASILSMGGATAAQVRMRLLAGTAGILTSFALLALALIGLKLAGGRLGWGIQFQNPWFLGVMMLVMTLFMLSLLDIIRLPIPAFAGQIRGRGLLGDFASGFMATILATPCSAPLVGTAISFALAASAGQLFVVMLVMGAGLAVPWLMLAAFPGFIAAMPTPGRWMKWVKPILASGLVATIIWLGWLLVGAAGLGAQNTLQNSAQNSGQNNSQQAVWQQWKIQAIADNLDAGRPVFVDVTADWCITCKVNKALTLNTKKIKAAFEAKDVVLLQADWTLPDLEIADYLASFGRFGIPFNILYFPDGQAPIIFDELLSPEKIVMALDKIN